VSCNVPLDFAIIVDTSGSISRRNFKLLLHFIRNLVDGFQVSEDHTHIAIIEYSTGASVQLGFNDLPGRTLTKNNVYDIVKRIPHKRGKTYIDRALRLANDEVFTLKGGMRDDVRKVRWFARDINGMSRKAVEPPVRDHPKCQAIVAAYGSWLCTRVSTILFCVNIIS